jgi:hypothetical protein
MGGQKISDHSFWAGKGANGSVFPMGAKTKNESSANGAGGLSMYEDTTEKIKASQERAEGEMKRHNRKEFERN